MTSRVALRPGNLWALVKYRLVLRRLAGPKILRSFADAYPEAVFVEIGANDGEQHDHLRPFIVSRPWRGVMVEPVPYVFERLRQNYRGIGHLSFENAAISDRDGKLPFYHLSEADPDERAQLPIWYDALGSFSREAVLSHARDVPDIKSRLVRIEVPCMTFDSLCARHGVQHLDLLVIDTEGYDWEIIRHIDLSAWRPRLVIYEHFHLEPNDRAACRSHLERVGYATMEEGLDTFCLRSGVQDALSARWRRLRPGVPGVSKHDETAE